MGIVFVMFAELWVTFFQTCTELWVQIVLEVRSAVAGESANDLYNCNDLCSLAGILYGIQLKSSKGFHLYIFFIGMATSFL